MSSQGTNNTVSEFKPPGFTQDKWQEYLDRGYEISNKYGTDPSLIYGNSPNQPMVAQMSDLQNKSANGIYGLASQGTPNDQIANSYLANMLNGNDKNIQPNNPYMGASSSYGGSSPQFEAMLAASNKDIGDAYGRGTAAQTDAAAARGGAFGGSGYNELKSAQNKQLTDTIAQNSNSMRNDQYNRSAQLEQQDIGRNSQLADAGINRAWQGYENAAGRGLQGAGLINQMGQSDLQRWLSVMGAGDLQRQVQGENIAAAKDLFGQNVGQPLQALDIFGNALSRASGQGGSSTASTFGGGQSGLANSMGGLAALYGLFGK